jgi:hypothetical protein
VPSPRLKKYYVRKLILFALLTSAALTVLAADKASFTGKWKTHSSIAGNESDGECTLTQTDNDLAGTCKTSDGTDAKATRKVDGAKVTWQFDSEYNGTPLTIKYDGTLDTALSKIAGTVSVDPFGVDGGFTATLVK